AYVGSMRVARDEMRESLLEQLERRPVRRATEAAVERGGGDLDEHALFDQGPQAIGNSLHLRVALRMRKNRCDPALPQPEDPQPDVQGPPVVRELDKQVAAVAG